MMRFGFDWRRLPAAGSFLLLATICAAESADVLVRRLGHRDFAARVAAERELLSVGASAMSAVADGLRSDDPEIRQRSQRLLSALQRISFRERQADLLATPWTVDSDIAPAWELYQLYTGDGPAARELYVQMIEQELDLMMLLTRQPDSWPTAFEQRCTDLRAFMDRRAGRGIHPASTATLIFLAVHPDHQPSPQALGAINILIADDHFDRAVQQTVVGPALRALLSQWVQLGGSLSPHSRLQTAAQFHLSDGLGAAREILANRQANGQSLPQLQNAIMFLAKYGGVDAIPELEALLDDETVLGRTSRAGLQKFDSSRTRTPDLQVNDVALLALLSATRQDPTAYGYTNLRPDPRFGYQAGTASFASDDARRAGRQRWAAWRARRLPKIIRPVEDASVGFAV